MVKNGCVYKRGNEDFSQEKSHFKPECLVIIANLRLAEE
jgi:hypothetical protein